MTAQRSHSLLVELLTEELPPKALPRLGETFAAAIVDGLKSRGLALGLPVTLLVDAGGCLLAHMNGPADWASEDARRLLAAVIDN